MHTHGPSCLPGPVIRDHDHWSVPAGADSPRNSNGNGRPVLFRRYLVERIRRQIAAGTYDTPEKFEAALERLVRRLEDE